MEDIIIIGAGIIGSLTAQKLSKYDCRVLIIEKNSMAGLEQTMSSSAIVHSGIDPIDGSLKSKYNVLGNKIMDELCTELNVEYCKVGGYICLGKNDSTIEYEKLKKNAIKREIEHRIINGKELRKFEPNISEDVIEAISLPTTGVIYPTDLTTAALEIALENGIKYTNNELVKNIEYLDNYFQVTTDKDCYKSKYIINAAGLNSCSIAKMIDKEFKYEVEPKRGAYFVLNKRSNLTKSVIYPVPNEHGKGVLAIPTTHGNILIGPNSVKSIHDDDAVYKSDLNYVRDQITRIIKDPKFEETIHVYAGVRASINSPDFVIEWDNKVKKMINLVGIDSPGIASSPAITNMIVEMILEKENFNKNNKYINTRQAKVNVRNLTIEKLNTIIKEKPKYGKIICRCELVSEQEIIDEIHKTNGARTINDIKYRLRPLMGQCQGSFCQSEIAKILARELEIDISEVLYRNEGTNIVLKSSKGESDEL